MRRETDKAESAIATMARVFSFVERGKISANYAIVEGRQSVADLTGVATDLTQVSAPTAQQQRAQAALRQVVTRETTLIDRTLNHLGDPATAARAHNELRRAARREQSLSERLG